MYRSLLVPLDGSGFAEAAIPTACALAKRDGATLVLVRVHVPIAIGELAGVERWEKEQRHSEREYLAATAQRARDAFPGLPVSSTLLEEPVAAAIAERAREIGADLIVMTTHGRTGVSRAWLGSVADDVVRHSSVPVLLVRPMEEPEALNLGRAVTFDRVLVPLDGSTLAEQVLEHAVKLASAAGAKRLALMRVVRPVIVRAVEYPLPYPLPLPAVDIEGTERLLVEARAYLSAVAERLEHGNPELSVTTEACEDDHPAAAMIRAAQSSDVMAMATHGRGASRIFLGSVADKVLRGASGSILLFRPTHD